MTDNSPITLSVFFPAYHDEGNITPVVNQAINVLESLNLKTYEIIIIEDGSPDKTAEAADRLAQRYDNVSVIHHSQNLGYGVSLVDGFKASRYDYVFYSDGDNQYDLKELKKFIALLPYSDMVIGFRRYKQYSLTRRFLSFSYNIVMRKLFGIHYSDLDCAFKLIPASLLKRINLTSNHGLIDAELLIKAHLLNYSLTEVGVCHLPRPSGLSTAASLSVITNSLKEIYRFWRAYKKNPASLINPPNPLRQPSKPKISPSPGVSITRDNQPITKKAAPAVRK